MTKQEFVKQKSAGRPKGGEHEGFVALRLPVAQMVALDIWRAESGLSRSEAIRRLIEAGLAAQPTDKSGEPSK